MGKEEIKSNYEHFFPAAKIQENYLNNCNHVLVRSLDELEEILNNKQMYIAFDLETTGLDPSKDFIVGFSFSFDNLTGYYVPVKHQSWGLGTESLRLIYNKLCNVKKVFLANCRFDMRMMEYHEYQKHGIKGLFDMSKVNYQDVLSAAWLADTNIKLPSLKWSSLFFCGIKQPTFAETLGDNVNFYYLVPEDCYTYATSDAICTFAVMMNTTKYLKESGFAGKLENDFLYTLLNWENEVQPIDIDYLYKLKAEVENELEALEAQIYSEVGYPFTINSGAQLADALESIGIHTGAFTKTGKMKTDIKTFEYILETREDAPEILRLLIERSKIFKLKTAFVDVLISEAERMNGKARFGYLSNNAPCLTESARVTIKGKGLISIKEVREGDYIWTQYGWKKVLWNDSHWSDEVWTVKLKNGREVTGTGHHPLLVNQSKTNSVWRPIWAPIKTLTTKDKICLNHKTTDNYEFTPVEYPELRSERIKRNSFVIPEFSPRVARILGFLDGDGCISCKDRVSLCFNVKETELIDYYVKEFEDLFQIKGYPEKVGKDNTLKVNFFSSQLRNWFKDLGVRGQGIPAIVMKSNPECWAHYLAGIWDSDGSVVIANNRYNPKIKLANEKTIKDIQLLMISLGMPTHVSKVKKERVTEKQRYELTARGGMGRCYFRDLIAPGLICNEKRRRASLISEKFYTGSLSWVSEVYKEHEGAIVYDIEVEDVHEYIAEGIVNHNTGRLAGSGEKSNPFFTSLNIQALPKPHAKNWYVHDYHPGDELKENDQVVLDWRFSLVDESNKIIEGSDPHLNFRAAFKAEPGHLICEQDAAGQEIKIMANISNEQNWIKPILNGADLHRCYSDDTQFLTEHGFKYYDEIKTDDKIAQYKDGKIEYVNFIDRYEGYSDTMVSLKDRIGDCDLLVTPNHRVLFRTSRYNKWKVWTADRLVGRSCVRIPVKMEFSGNERTEPFKFDEVRVRGRMYSDAVSFDADTFIEYLGFYLGDGHAGVHKSNGGNSYRLNISQSLKENKSSEWLLNLNNRMGNFFRENRSNDGHIILEASNKNIVQFIIRNFLSSGEKRIPEWIYNLSLRQRELFIQAFIRADGHIPKGKSYRMLYAKSLNLIEDLERLCIISGYKVHRYPHSKEPKKSNIKGKEVITESCYYFGITRIDDVKVKVENVQEKHRVVCFTVPSSFLVVRRNGAVSVSGNSMAENMWGKENYNRDLRKRAKVMNFGGMYGMSVYSIMQKFSLPEDEAQDIYDRFWAAIPNIKAFQTAMIRKAYKTGTVYNYFGLPRRVKYWLSSEDSKKRAFGRRTVQNQPVQSCGAVWLKVGAMKWEKRFSSKWGDKVHFRATVHDSISRQIKICPEINELLSDLASALYLRVPGWPLPLPCTTELGNSWGLMFGFKYDKELNKWVPDYEEV